MTGLFVRQLTVIDFSYLDEKRGVVGESWQVDVALFGDLDDQGMVFDFGHVKKRIKQAIDASVDHCLVVPAQADWVNIMSENPCRLSADLIDGGQIVYEAPEGATTLLPSDAVTIASVQQALMAIVQAVVPENVHRIELKLYPETINDAYYHYSHGLKKHEGDCQRIAHGHRSRIEIFLNDQRDTQLEKAWAKRWQDIYLITREDIVREFSEQNIAYYQVSYQANQGEFSITIPARCCEVLETDSTVELIADFIANQVKQEHQDSAVTIYAYEGVNKGAISHA